LKNPCPNASPLGRMGRCASLHAWWRGGNGGRGIRRARKIGRVPPVLIGVGLIKLRIPDVRALWIEWVQLLGVCRFERTVHETRNSRVWTEL